MTLVEKIAITIASIMTVIIIGVLAKKAYDYKQADTEYESLQQYATEVSDTSDAAQVEAINPIIPEEKEDEVHELARNYYRKDFPDIEVDFKSLLEMNKDTVGWLYVGACDISYPIVQGEDNDYYMHKTFEDKNNAAGAILMDYRDNPQLEDWNTFIYGHNMKNGSMFGSLKKFLSDKTLWEKDPYIYIFIPGYIYRYKIFSYYKDTPDSKMYWTPDNLKEYRQYIRDAKTKSLVDTGVETSEDNNMITLVTCSGMGEGKMRFFVHGEFIDRYVFE